MTAGKKGIAGAALMAMLLAAQAIAQTRTARPAATPTALAMPKTDRMPMAEFKNLLAKGQVVVLDVRSGDAYAGGHIPGALSVPEETITTATAEKLKRLGKPVATYCA